MPHIHIGTDGQVAVVHRDGRQRHPHAVLQNGVDGSQPFFGFVIRFHALPHCLCQVVPLSLLLGKQLLQHRTLASGEVDHLSSDLFDSRNCCAVYV